MDSITVAYDLPDNPEPTEADMTASDAKDAEDAQPLSTSSGSAKIFLSTIKNHEDALSLLEGPSSFILEGVLSRRAQDGNNSKEKSKNYSCEMCPMRSNRQCELK